jgi:hypothetical protein
MWEFLGDMIRGGDLVATSFAVVLIAFALTTRTLWNANQAINRQLRDQQERFRQELTALHEKRVVEAQEIVRQVISHVETTKASVDRIRSAMEVLTDVLGGRKR